MIKLLFIFVMLWPAWLAGDYPLKNGKPTSKGIKQYVEEQSESVIREYQEFVGDTLYNIWIYTKDLAYFGGYDSLELGRYFPHEIYISTAETFEAYELDDLSPERKNSIGESNKFVKGTLIHELTHEYVNQIGIEMRSIHQISVHSAYQIDLWIVRSPEMFGSTFIEEGLCEYLTEKMGELIPPKHPFIPKTIEDLVHKDNRYLVNYKYAPIYLKTFLDSTGFKEGVKILLHNPPPTHEEVLNPDLFFGRLELF